MGTGCEAAPRNFDLEQFGKDVRSSPGVRSSHCLHVWALKPPAELCCSVHVICEPKAELNKVITAVTRLAHSRGIKHCAVQASTLACDDHMPQCD